MGTRIENQQKHYKKEKCIQSRIPTQTLRLAATLPLEKESRASFLAGISWSSFSVLHSSFSSLFSILNSDFFP